MRGRRRVGPSAGPALLGLLVALAVLAGAWPGLGHELPTFLRVRLLAVLRHPWEPATRILSVEVRDPDGRTPVAGAEVLVSGLERERGSAVRLPGQWLAPTPQPGVYQGAVEFPGAGGWDLTVTVRGPYVGEAHFEVEIAGTLPRAASRGGQPKLAFGWRGVLLLLLNWGHVVGFGLWLGVTGLALLRPQVAPRATVLLTGLALALAIGTGFRGRVAYIDPRVDPQARTAKVRVEVPNRDGRLRLGMYMTMAFTPARGRAGRGGAAAGGPDDRRSARRVRLGPSPGN